MVIAVRLFGLRKERGKVTPEKFLRRIPEKPDECGVAGAELSLQIGGENGHLRLRVHRIPAAIGRRTVKRLLLFRTVVRSRHSGGCVMLTQSGGFDREACYARRNESNTFFLRSQKNRAGFTDLKNQRSTRSQYPPWLLQ